ncbi:hypothetical protein BJY04DRAFT_191541 [Aspergillus karnatakaensis]|uniref:uncharacterized protein n=1 Tax=Aspergillus karnatakaensis TaxID=1810916 RepID=UPI003CCC9331
MSIAKRTHCREKPRTQSLCSITTTTIAIAVYNETRIKITLSSCGAPDCPCVVDPRGSTSEQRLRVQLERS